MTLRSPHREDGWVLVTAIVLMAIMLTVGLAAYAFVDTGQTRSRESRERESSLSLAEGVLYAQGFALSKNWPNANKPLGGDCSSAAAVTATTNYCPNRDQLAAATSGTPSVAQFSDTDFLKDATWTTSVRDNSGKLEKAFDTSIDPTTGKPYTEGKLTDTTYGHGDCPYVPCRLDWNGDRQLWVQARAVVRGRPRNIVARLKLEELRESVPTAGVVAGRLDVTNNGKKEMLNATGTSILLRCPDVTSATCANYQASKGQVTPAPTSAPAQGNFMTADQIQRFKERAQAEGTYFPAGTCPADAGQLTGAVVFVERCDKSYPHTSGYSTPCNVPSDMAANCINPTNKPGMLIWHCGTFGMSANQTFYGIVYMVNNSDGTCSGWTAKSGECGSGTIYETTGGGGTYGALVVDGDACVSIGSNSLNIAFDANVFNSVTSFGTVGLVQNTWRELRAG